MKKICLIAKVVLMFGLLFALSASCFADTIAVFSKTMHGYKMMWMAFTDDGKMVIMAFSPNGTLLSSSIGTYKGDPTKDGQIESCPDNGRWESHIISNDVLTLGGGITLEREDVSELKRLGSMGK